jgi:septum formation protein
VSIQRKIVLASASPRRAEILRNAGFEFEIIPAEIDESMRPRETTEAYVRRLAKEKALSVARQLPIRHGLLHRPVVGADTTVRLEGEILGKPGSAEEARKMLRRLSGKWHEVLTGLAVVVMRIPTRRISSKTGIGYGAGGETWIAVEKTRVEFARLSEKEIEEYIKTDEPFDKAGAYAIQGRGGKFIPRIEGCYFNVMGLPLARLYAMLKEIEAVPM